MRLPKLPELVASKLYKTGQTRGANPDEIYQNRVGRNSTVLIPSNVWKNFPDIRKKRYENDYIVLIPPKDYFDSDSYITRDESLVVGENALIFYQQRSEWENFPPNKFGLKIPNSRKRPLNGSYVARIANTTSEKDERINRGFCESGLRGAGIRLYEYSDTENIKETRLQLEAIIWHAIDAEEKFQENGMSPYDIEVRRTSILQEARDKNLLDHNTLKSNRIINNNLELVCPLCLNPISVGGLMERMPQATGRERHDLTVTEINLFHIEELSHGIFNHRPYNLGWGHHHCNVVCKDSGIIPTLQWMDTVVQSNDGLF